MIMSQYERQRIEAAIENEINRSRPLIVQGHANRLARRDRGAQKRGGGRLMQHGAKRRNAGDLHRLSDGTAISAAWLLIGVKPLQEAQAEYQRALDSSDTAKHARLCRGIQRRVKQVS